MMQRRHGKIGLTGSCSHNARGSSRSRAIWSSSSANPSSCAQSDPPYAAASCIFIWRSYISSVTDRLVQASGCDGGAMRQVIKASSA